MRYFLGLFFILIISLGGCQTTETDQGSKPNKTAKSGDEALVVNILAPVREVLLREFEPQMLYNFGLMSGYKEACSDPDRFDEDDILIVTVKGYFFRHPVFRKGYSSFKEEYANDPSAKLDECEGVSEHLDRLYGIIKKLEVKYSQ